MNSFPAGAAVVSATLAHADTADPDLGGWPVGGLVYDTWADSDGEIWLHVVDVWRGQIRYHTLAAADAQPGYSGGLVNTRYVRQVLQALQRDSLKDPVKHLTAITALGRVLEAKTPQRRNR
jgi:hypothetical protein